MRTFLIKRSRLIRALIYGMAGYALALVVLFATACRGKRLPAEKPLTVAQAVEQTSASCQRCHAEIHAAWSGTDHALANRPVNPVADREALATFAERAGEGVGEPDLVLGHLPLWQPLIPATGNRWQPHELAFDPERREWFNVFAASGRHAGEWGHWTGRGMNWNSMCAHCHMTGFQKNYDAATDGYRSTWVEHGVGCIQCHGPMPEKHGDKAAKQDPHRALSQGDRARMMQTCAPCHARNEQLTLHFQPGAGYDDHYRVTLPVDPAVFYSDGQQRDEVFNWSSVLLSRMGHAGVTCMDCHDPHSTKTILPVSNNALCLQCHGAPGRVQPNGVRAVVIDPLAHSHHREGSAGNSCIACHMPATTYMQRAPRHDHGWLKPDPLLTRELGIPNACSTCHVDQTVDWAIARADEWYGDRLNSRQRARARAVAAAQSGKPAGAGALLSLLEQEDIPAWRATYLELLTAYPDPGDRAGAVARAALTAAEAVERAAAVRHLSARNNTATLLGPALKDPSRLVRLDAAWALSPELGEGSAERTELDDYLATLSDQPAGQLRRGQDLANRGRLIEAEQQMRTAAAWDPFSPGIREALGLVLAAQSRPEEAANELASAARLSPNDALLAFRAGLALAETGRMAQAEASLREATARDPRFSRAWYNLGLLVAQTERLAEAAKALRTAENLEPAAAEFSYALATVLWRKGDVEGARDAARRALENEPTHAGAAQILRSTERRN